MKNCIPTVFYSVLLVVYSIVDGLFVGRLTDDIGLAAINTA